MRRRAIRLISAAVLLTVLFVGIPTLALMLSNIWSEAQTQLEARAKTVALSIDAYGSRGVPVDTRILEHYAPASDSYPMHISYRTDTGKVYTAGAQAGGGLLSAAQHTYFGGTVTVSMPRSVLLARSFWLIFTAACLFLAAYGVGIAVALRQSRRISAPLIYLAASAEQVGAGQVRPKIKRSGIEEIDLVSQELERTADRVAGRIAAERQFAAAAAHQLRTPLTALSMRVEEIQYLSENEAVSEEAEKALEQTERLSGVIDDLMANSRRQTLGNMEAITPDDIFHQQSDEWDNIFASAGRGIKFKIETDAVVLATPGAVAQILATLIENSLKYGAGTTLVKAGKSAQTVVIKVSDEGEGVSGEIAPVIFQRGFSTGGSTGIGLAVAKELAENLGGRLELTRQKPAEFTLTLKAIPASLDPHLLVPQGAVYSAGSRRHRR